VRSRLVIDAARRTPPRRLIATWVKCSICRFYEYGTAARDPGTATRRAPARQAPAIRFPRPFRPARRRRGTGRRVRSPRPCGSSLTLAASTIHAATKPGRTAAKSSSATPSREGNSPSASAAHPCARHRRPPCRREPYWLPTVRPTRARTGAAATADRYAAGHLSDIAVARVFDGELLPLYP
jgi:hypothetical protein